MTDPMVAQLANEVRRLSARLAALEQMRPSGVGVSTAFGATNIRPTQTGFAAELTGAYESGGTDTGYPWKRLDLVPPAFVDPDVQLTGDKAFTIDDNQTLVAGQLGWLDVSDTAGGWVFSPTGSAGISHGESQPPGTLISVGSWTDVTFGQTITLPSAGTYLIYFALTVDVQLTTAVGATVYCYGRVYDVTAGAQVHSPFMAIHPQVSGVRTIQTVSGQLQYTVTASSTLRIDMTATSGTWAVLQNLAPASGGFMSKFGWLKL